MGRVVVGTQLGVRMIDNLVVVGTPFVLVVEGSYPVLVAWRHQLGDMCLRLGPFHLLLAVGTI